jgi:anionic cell wall polymer biosynthesis LytR-Cps2A-Psr (LCP) family protein
MVKKRIIVIVFLLLALIISGLIITKKSPVERRLEKKEEIFFLLLTLEKKDEPKSLKDILLINYQPDSKKLTLVAIPPQTLISRYRNFNKRKTGQAKRAVIYRKTETGQAKRAVISDKRTLKNLYRQNLQRNNFHKGCLFLKSAMEEFLNLEIPFYLVFDEEGFIKAVDLLGGMEVEVDQPIPFGEGFLEDERLNGEESLAYLEFEELRFGEFGKFIRWQRFIWTLIQRFNNSSLDTKLVKELLKNSSLTNLKAKDILALAQEAKNIREAGIKVEKIPGKTIYKDWMSYWLVDTLATTQLFKELDRRLGEKKGIIQVEVLNGCGRGGIAFQVAQDLRKKGLDVVNIGNARNFKYRKTLILNRSGKKGMAKRISEIMGCGEPQDRIEKKALVDVTIIIGKDYLKR